MKDYLSCAETAKLVRAALKRAFPGVKFGVRSHVYAGGASINVSWTDGPSKKDVDAVVNPYKGGGFDGMIDMAFSVDSYLMPDGSASFASSPGTAGSMGTYEAYSYDPPPGARKVHFGANFIFTDKEFSPPVYIDAVAKVCSDYGMEMPKIRISDYNGEASVDGYYPVPGANTDLATMVWRELAKENYE